MKNHSRRTSVRIVAMILVLALAAGVLLMIPGRAADTSALGELGDSFTANSSVFTLSTGSRFFIVSESEPDEALVQTVQLSQRKFAAAGYPSTSTLSIVWGADSDVESGDIVVYLKPGFAIAAEGYQLAVTTTASVTAKDVDGLMYGLDMLLKHFRNAGENKIKGFSYTDAPDTAERTVSLDCGRKYFTKEWICNFIREMSWMGYNTLQLHFSDDSGFRADIWDSTYYKGQFQPQNDFSWLCGGVPTSWAYDYYIADYPSGHADLNKYLTAAELIEILNVAKEYHIDVIPSFDSPAHLDYITWKFHQNYKNNSGYSFYSTYNKTTYYASSNSGIINYTNNGNKYNANYSQWPYYAAVNVKQDMGKAFIFELYIDIANFFKEYSGSTDFSVGADEVNLSSGYNVQWGYSDFVTYIGDLNTLLNGMGYTMRMYNDFIGSTTYSGTSSQYADNIEIMYWNSPFDPDTGASGSTSGNYTKAASHFTADGRILYNCIQSSTYYGLRYTSNPATDARGTSNSTNYWTFYHANEQDIFNEWYPANINEYGDYRENVADIPNANLGGGYYLIWCDFFWINTEAEIWNGCTGPKTGSTMYYLRDRMWSNIIKMWNWDLNSSMTYSEYATLRGKFGTAPGISSCSAAASLPSATSPQPASVTLTHSVVYKSLADSTVLLTESVQVGSTSYKIPLTPIAGYSHKRADNGSITSEGGTTYVTGSAGANATITVWCGSAGDDSWLNELLREENREAQGDYTYATWAAYTAALEKAETKQYTSQAEIDALIEEIQAAHAALAINYDGEHHLAVDQLAASYPVGKQVGLIVTTCPDATFLNVSLGDTKEALTFCSAQVQEIDGEPVKRWMLYFPADVAGTFTYTVSNRMESQEVTVVVE